MAVEGQALGFVETVGLVAATEAADAMVKAANVEIVTRQQPGGGYTAINCPRRCRSRKGRGRSGSGGGQSGRESRVAACHPATSRGDRRHSETPAGEIVCPLGSTAMNCPRLVDFVLEPPAGVDVLFALVSSAGRSVDREKFESVSSERLLRQFG
jgi:hypothetical protein